MREIVQNKFYNNLIGGMLMSKHIRQEVLKFLNDGQNVIVLCLTSCLDTKRRTSSMLFDEQTFIKLGMKNAFTNVMRKKFGKNIQIDFDMDTLANNENDFFSMQYEKLLKRYYTGHEKLIRQKALEYIQNIDEQMRQI